MRRFTNLLLNTVLFISLCGADSSSAQEALTNQDCLDCHSDEELTKEGPHGEEIALFIDGARFDGTVHGAFTCTDCHAGISELPHDEELPRVDCSECHDDVVEAYDASVHGISHENGNGDAPYCSSCHGDIHVLAPFDDASSPVNPARLPETCGSCHANPDILKKYNIHIAPPIEAYRQSVHARVIREGLRGASCSDCHGSHAILRSANPDSSVSRLNVAETCGQCHSDVTDAYKESVHGRAFSDGVLEAPTCTNCHGEHRILSPREEGSPVYLANLPQQSCGHCHSDVRLSEKYGLPLDRVPSYNDSYHGLAVRSGRQTVAGCASCHGIHDILPSSDPFSHVHSANLPETCGKCHPGAGTRFAIGPVHVTSTDASNPVTYYVRIIYLPLIFLTIGGMAVHNVFDFVKKSRTPELRALSVASLGAAPERMMLGFRIAHILVAVSFPVLVYTGFALKYPESWWAQPINQWENLFDLRGWVHRGAGVMLIAAFAFHFIHVLRNRRARACVWRMRPTMDDLRELKERILYYLGLRGDPPHGVELGYIEKSEYLAFLWGTLIMAVTGFLLWFETLTLEWLPAWAVEAATAVHFYEAVLATLAILVWHFYWVIFDPAVYPMDASWLTGKAPMSRELERRSRPNKGEPPSDRRT